MTNNFLNNISIISDSDEETILCSKGMILQQSNNTKIISFNKIEFNNLTSAKYHILRVLPYLPTGVVILSLNQLDDKTEILLLKYESFIFLSQNNGLPALIANLIPEENVQVFKVNPIEEIPISGSINTLRDIMAPVAGLIAASQDYNQYIEPFPVHKIVPFAELEPEQHNLFFIKKHKYGYNCFNFSEEELLSLGYVVGENILVKYDNEQFEVPFSLYNNAEKSTYFFIDDHGMLALYSETEIRKSSKLFILKK